jgi:uncharacterized protein (DUF302 family)
MRFRSSILESAMKYPLLAISIALVLAPAAPQAHDVDLITKASHYSVDDTLNRLESIVAEKGFQVFAKIDHAEAAKQVGLTLRPTRLLIFGNPRAGTAFMQADQRSAIDLPLKALVWQAADGAVFLSYNTASFLSERHQLQGLEDALSKLNGALDAMARQATE